MDRDEDLIGKIARIEEAKGLGGRVCAELRAYWEALRNGRLVPAREEVDPRGIERALQYTFILERVAPGMGRFRLAGMHLCDLMGMEVRGMPLTAFFAAGSRQQVSEACEAVFRDPAIAEADLTSEPGYGRPQITARMLLLPLRSDLGDVTRMLGCLVAEGPIVRAPRRFEVKDIRIHMLSGQPVATEWPQPAPQRDIAGFAEPATPFEAPATSPEARRARFRVI